MIRYFLLLLLFAQSCKQEPQQSQSFNVIAYYSGNSNTIDNYDVSKLTHIIFSFCHLKDNRLNVNNAADTATLHKLVSLKENNPGLKIMLSLGGWGGCYTCSDVFNSEEGRREFAASVKELNDYFKTDGLDFDWEYPTIEGHPGHPYRKEDKDNFTDLVKKTREALGTKNELSFAAGGFNYFLKESVNWAALEPYLDRVNLMSYDLVGGYSKVTGHHTPLYSSAQQVESADNAIQFLDSIKFPLNKLVIGAAFYARTWELDKPSSNNGLYETGSFKNFVPYRSFDENFKAEDEYKYFFDSVAQAGYMYSEKTNIFATFDNPQTVVLKTKYALEKGLNGIMFWELPLDKPKEGLLDAIYQTVSELH